jgi:hypothetical protein
VIQTCSDAYPTDDRRLNSDRKSDRFRSQLSGVRTPSANRCCGGRWSLSDKITSAGATICFVGRRRCGLPAAAALFDGDSYRWWTTTTLQPCWFIVRGRHTAASEQSPGILLWALHAFDRDRTHQEATKLQPHASSMASRAPAAVKAKRGFPAPSVAEKDKQDAAWMVCLGDGGESGSHRISGAPALARRGSTRDWTGKKTHG